MNIYAARQETSLYADNDQKLQEGQTVELGTALISFSHDKKIS